MTVASGPRWAKVIDQTACIGCHACSTACKSENAVPLGVNRTYVKYVDVGEFPAARRAFQVTRCNQCDHPPCVTACPTSAILIGNLNDPDSRVARYVNRDVVAVRRPEKETRPKLFYKGAHQATLDPLAARRPTGGLFMWSEQLETPAHVVAGNPTYNNTSAAALLAYDVPHALPWDWRVSLYTWTKGIAAGAYLVPPLFVLFGVLRANNPLWLWVAP